MLTNVSSSVFENSKSIKMLPVVSAEWNNNLYQEPYVVVSGDGTLISPSSSPTLTSVTNENAYPGNLTTSSFSLPTGSNVVSKVFSFTRTYLAGEAYKIVFFAKTDGVHSVLLNTTTEYGSNSKELNSLSWTKIEIYLGWNTQATPTTITLNLNASNLVNYNPTSNIYITTPEMYKITRFDYGNGSLWSAYSPFKFFRPGESYVQPGNADIEYPNNYRLATKGLSFGQSSQQMPISPISYNPNFALMASPVGIYKNGVPNDMMPYQYFLSSSTDAEKIITAKYTNPVYSNKLIVKFNAVAAIPTVQISINGSSIGTFTPDDAGLLDLYYDSGSWSQTRWDSADTPQLTDTGTISSGLQTINSIQILQTSASVNSGFSDSIYSSIQSEIKRMQIIEISPRVEIDFSNLVKDYSINKSMDSSNQYLPISSLNANDASITLSAIPFTTQSGPLPIFSNNSNLSNVFLRKLLTKNVKFYLNFLLEEYSDDIEDTSKTYIPAGVYYSDSWNENDANDVSISLYDSIRYLQTMPVPDYVASGKNVFEIITNIFDLAGFTDYDHDSLYDVCNNPSAPLDISYYYCNSQDTTIAAAISEICLAYQLGAYMDEYGILRFTSLSDILKNTTSDIAIDDNDIIENGFSATSNPNPGKLSLRYQSPKIKQSLSLQNMNDFGVRMSPSFVFTTSNDVVWSQQTLDSVGFNYLSENMSVSDNHFEMPVQDLLDIFHTYSLNSNGYAAIEDEIVSFEYKEYTISKINGLNPETVSIRNDLELQAEVQRYIKKYNVGFTKRDGVITGATANGMTITFTGLNNLLPGDTISISGIVPDNFNQKTATVKTANAGSFVIDSSETGTYVSGGSVVAKTDFDIKITPTGRITNVKRGLFNSKSKAHNLLTNTLSSKDLSAVATGGSSVIADPGSFVDGVWKAQPKIKISSFPGAAKAYVYPTTERDAGNNFDTITGRYLGYQTYVTKFNFQANNLCAAGIFFNRPTSLSESGTYFVELIRAKNDKNAYDYYCVVYYNNSGSNTILAYADVSTQVNAALSNFPKIMKKTQSKPSIYKLRTDILSPLTLKVVHFEEEKAFGNVSADGNRVLDVFINNTQINAWRIPNAIAASNYIAMPVNPVSGNRKKIELPTSLSSSQTVFGVYGTVNPVPIGDENIPAYGYSPALADVCKISEIYATQANLIDNSANYYYQDKRFLDSVLQGKNSTEKTYCMQTMPFVSGINYYDVQYTTPAAVNVDVLPIEYLWHYFPGSEIEDQKWYQKSEVKESHLSYSTPINTGFRAKMLIANNAHHMVFLNKEADDLNQFTVRLNLWTHEIIAPSDPELITKVVKNSNIAEVAQIDSEWIQSRTAAEKMLSVIAAGIEPMSKTISLDIYGNPLIQVGDIINLSYPLSGILNNKYLVKEVSHSFNNGLSTSLQLALLKSGPEYQLSEES